MNAFALNSVLLMIVFGMVSNSFMTVSMYLTASAYLPTFVLMLRRCNSSFPSTTGSSLCIRRTSDAFCEPVLHIANSSEND